MERIAAQKAIIYPYFTAFEKLKLLSIGENYLETYEVHLLPRNLTEFDGNTAILPIFPSLGIYAPFLQRIRLDHCGMKVMSVQHVSGLAEVKILALHSNTLIFFPDISFMKYLDTLKLNGNRLASVPDLYELPLTTLTLDDNPLVCDKALCWLRMWPWMKASTIPSDEPTCAGPVEMAGMKLMDVDPVLMECFRG